MFEHLRAEVTATLAGIREAGLYKHERALSSPQAAHISTAGRGALNFCANNYLGLADHPDVVAAARAVLDVHGFGMASVRFICGTQDAAPSSWSTAWPTSSGPRRRSCTRRASTPTVACSRCSSATATRSSPTS
ncbi:MAG: hypothetical protein V9E89_03990 [Ilumatobacteraceae bacterium]